MAERKLKPVALKAAMMNTTGESIPGGPTKDATLDLFESDRTRHIRLHTSSTSSGRKKAVPDDDPILPTGNPKLREDRNRVAQRTNSHG